MGAAKIRRTGIAGVTVDDLIREFLVESNENLDLVDSELVKLEADLVLRIC